MHYLLLPESRKPVCLPPKGFGLPAGSTMTVTGWGYLEENGEKPSTPSVIITQRLHLKKLETQTLHPCYQARFLRHFRRPPFL